MNSQQHLFRYMVAPVAVVAPDIGVMQKYAQPFFSHEGALAQMMQPAHCPVPVSPTISDNARDMLSSASRGFFRNVMRPTVKHV